MTHVLRCGCGLKFDTKGLAAGTSHRCPMCGRNMVVPARDLSSPWSRIGRRGRAAVALGGVATVGAAGVTALVLSGVLGRPEAAPKPIETAKQAPAPPPASADPKPFEYQRNPGYSNIAPDERMMLQAGPIEPSSGLMTSPQ